MKTLLVLAVTVFGISSYATNKPVTSITKFVSSVLANKTYLGNLDNGKPCWATVHVEENDFLWEGRPSLVVRVQPSFISEDGTPIGKPETAVTIFFVEDHPRFLLKAFSIEGEVLKMKTTIAHDDLGGSEKKPYRTYLELSAREVTVVEYGPLFKKFSYRCKF